MRGTKPYLKSCFGGISPFPLERMKHVDHIGCSRIAHDHPVGTAKG